MAKRGHGETIDLVEHKKKIKMDETITRPFDASEREAKDLIYKGGHVMRPFLGETIGCAVIYFYKIKEDYFEYRTFASLERVPEGLARKGTEGIIHKCMESYGVKPPKSRN